MPDTKEENRAVVQAFKQALTKMDVRKETALAFLDGAPYSRKLAMAESRAALGVLATSKAIIGRWLVIVKVLDEENFEAFYTGLRLSRTTAWRYAGEALITRHLTMKQLQEIPDAAVRLCNELDLNPEEVDYIAEQGFFKGMDPLAAACKRPQDAKLVDKYQKKTRDQLIVSILEILRERDESHETVKRLEAEKRRLTGPAPDAEATEFDKRHLAFATAAGRLVQFLKNGADAAEVHEKHAVIVRQTKALMQHICDALAEADVIPETKTK